MSKNRLICLTAFFVFLFANKGFAFDWKTLHEDYRNISLEQAFEELSKEPDSVEKNYKLALHYLDAHQNDAAEKSFKNILKIDSDNYGAKWGLAEVARRRHEYDKSIPALETIIKEHPEFAPPYLSLAFNKYVLLDFKETGRLTSKVINLGKKKVDLDNLVRAHGLYAGSKAILMKKDNPIKNTFHLLAIRKHVKIAKKLDPDSVTALVADGNFYMSLPSFLGRDLDKARKLFKKAIEKDPFYPEPYIRIGQIFLEEGDRESYQKYLDKAYEIDPQNEITLDVINGTCIFVCIEDPK